VFLIVETRESRFEFFDDQRSNEDSFEKKMKIREQSRKKSKKMFQRDDRADEVVCYNDYKYHSLTKEICL
jgi:hypothetical protein